MGINIEYCVILNHLYGQGMLKGNRVLEFGAQDISANPVQLAAFRRLGKDAPQIFSIDTAQTLYNSYGYKSYTSIDATRAQGSISYDLNLDLVANYGFIENFDLVTDLGTFEHCFNIGMAFRNAHAVCAAGGIMIHVSWQGPFSSPEDRAPLLTLNFQVCNRKGSLQFL